MEIQKFTKCVDLRDKSTGCVYNHIWGTEKDDIYDMVVKIIVTSPYGFIKGSDLYVSINEPYDETKVRDFIDRVNKVLDNKEDKKEALK